MVEFLLFCIATVGMTSIITQGVIFLPLRQRVGDSAEKSRNYRERKAQSSSKILSRSMVEWFDELINCAQCTGFWCGLFCGLFFISSVGCEMTLFGVPYLLLMWFCCGVGGSFLAAFGCNLIDWVFYHKMNALRRLEEQDIMLAAQQAELQETQGDGQ